MDFKTKWYSPENKPLDIPTFQNLQDVTGQAFDEFGNYVGKTEVPNQQLVIDKLTERQYYAPKEYSDDALRYAKAKVDKSFKPEDWYGMTQIKPHYKIGEHISAGYITALKSFAKPVAMLPTQLVYAGSVGLNALAKGDLQKTENLYRYSMQNWSDTLDKHGLGADPELSNMLTAKVGSIAGQTASSLLIAATVSSVGGLPAVATVFGSTQFADVLEEGLEKGLPHDKAVLAAFLAAVPEGGLEAVGFKMWSGAASLNKTFRNLALAFLWEGAQEGSQQIAESTITNLFKIREQTFFDIVADVALSALVGGLVGLGGAAISGQVEQRNIALKKEIGMTEQGNIVPQKPTDEKKAVPQKEGQVLNPSPEAEKQLIQQEIEEAKKTGDNKLYNTIKYVANANDITDESVIDKLYPVCRKMIADGGTIDTLLEILGNQVVAYKNQLDSGQIDTKATQKAVEEIKLATDPNRVDEWRESRKSELEKAGFTKEQAGTLSEHISSIAENLSQRLGFDITEKKPVSFEPNLQEKAGTRGQITLGKTIAKIALNKNADPTTVEHEFFHYIDSVVKDAAKEGNKEAEKLLKKRESIIKQAKSELKKNGITKFPSDEEIIASAYEKWLWNGAKSEDATEQKLFEAIRDFFRDVYQSLRGLMGVRISPEADAYFRAMTGTAKIQTVDVDSFTNIDDLLNSIPKEQAKNVFHRVIYDERVTSILDKVIPFKDEIAKKKGNKTLNEYMATEATKEEVEKYSNLVKEVERTQLEVAKEIIKSENIYQLDNTLFQEGIKYDKNGKADINSPEFKKWFGNSKVVDGNGKPLVVYHGSTREFEVFDISKANVESDLGKGFYFTNNEDDVNANYHGGGPDFEIKIDRIAERIQNEEGIEWEQAKAKAYQQEYQTDALYEVYLKMEKPFVIGGKDETVLTLEEPYDEETDEYGEPEGTLLDFAYNMDNYLADIGIDYKISQELFMRASENGGEISASEIYDIIKNDENLLSLLDYESSFGELLSDTVGQEYDGIIDNTVNQKFGSERKQGQAMNGMDTGTTHYIVFNPKQIKSVYNRGTFDTESPNIYYQKETQEQLFRNDQATKHGNRVLDKAPTNQEVEDELEIIKSGRVEKAKEAKRGLGIIEGLGDALITVRQRVGVIDKRLKYAFDKLDYNEKMMESEYGKRTLPFIKKYRKLADVDKKILKYLIGNQQTERIREFMREHEMTQEYNDVRDLLDELFEEGNRAGMDMGFLQEYFPTKVSDYKSFISYLMGTDKWSEIELALNQIDPNHQLSDEERADAINSILRGYNRLDPVGKKGFQKERKILHKTPEMLNYYMDVDEALMRYISGMTGALAIRKAFNVKGAFNSEESIGGVVNELIKSGQITQKEEPFIKRMIKARLNYARTAPIVSLLKNFGYLGTMNSITSAITQIGDLYASFYKYNFPTAMKAIFGKSEITKDDLYLDSVWEEFTDDGFTSVAVNKLFTAIGLNAFDKFGKNTAINGAWINLKERAKNNDVSLLEDLSAAFGSQAGKVLADIKANNITSEVKLMLWSQLADTQPIGKSGTPVGYLSNGYTRIFYQLKTYTINQLSLFYADGLYKIQKGIATKNKKLLLQGTGNLAKLALLLTVFNAGADVLKNLIMGRGIEISDTLVSNMLWNLGVSKYTFYRGQRDGYARALFENFFPPQISMFDEAQKEARKIYTGKKKASDTIAVTYVPVVGRMWYWWFGGGRTSEKKKGNKPFQVKL